VDTRILNRAVHAVTCAEERSISLTFPDIVRGTVLTEPEIGVEDHSVVPC
jgi:hypothetical protein